MNISDIQVIVFADSFEKKFSPISQHTPKVLFPMVNDVLIEYTLTWLQSHNVREIIVVYKNRQEDIEKYFEKKKSKKRQNIHLVKVPDAKSIGDALREIQHMQIIHSDFIMLNADTVCNINLNKALQFYHEKKQQNKSNIMTSILRQRSDAFGNLIAEEDFYLYTIDRTNQIQQVDNLNHKFNVRFNNERTKMDKGQSQNYQIFSNLVDCEIYICSYDVLKAFQENFEFHHLKDDFMREILTSEIKEEKFHIYVVPQTEIAVRVRTPRLYYHVSMALLKGIFKPFTPSSNHLKGSQYQYEDIYKYFGSHTVVHHTSSVSESSAIGDNSKIAQHSKINKSIIGRNCTIGNGCLIQNCIIWDDVVIEDGVQITDSLVAKNVTIHKDSKIQKGCLIAQGVVIKQGAQVPPQTRLEHSETESKYCLLGSECQGSKTTDSSFGYQQDFLNSLVHDPSQLGADPTDEELDLTNKLSSSKTNQKKETFEDEVQRMIIQCDDDPQNISETTQNIELMKLYGDKTLNDCIEASVQGILYSLTQKQFETPQEKMLAIKDKISLWKTFLAKFVNGDHEAETLIAQLETFCTLNETFSETIQIFLQLLFKEEILSSEQILAWASVTEQKEDETSKKFLALNKNFIDWLKSQDEEQEEEEEEEDEEQV